MATSFSALKSSTTVESLTKKMESENKSFVDDRFWKPVVDANGNGYAIIRFLPPSKDDDSPWVKYYNHAYKNPNSGKWLIENCPTSIGQECCICSANSKLWNSGVESDKAIVRTRKRQVKYTTNIYIVSDPKNTENEGKVFLYTFGTKIFEKISECLKPNEEFEKKIPFDPFSFWTGANFRLKIKNVAKQRNYDSSVFDPQSALSTDDSILEKIWEAEYCLKDFLDPKLYLDEKTLEKKFRDSISDGTQVYSTPQQSAPQMDAVEAKTEDVPASNKYQEFLNKFKEDKEDDDSPF